MPKKILIIEDEKAIANAIKLKLEKNRFEVEIADNGEEGCQILEKRGYDLIILDLIMPKFNGFDVLNKLKFVGNKTPIIVSTNLGQEDDIKKAKELGAMGYFIKSNTPIVNIVEQIKNILKI